ncbi:MAG: penicillin-binding protein 1C [Desulfovibrio sp.]|nr:penicillin-binding protein 1C [Desulfovibrio sp.]
MQRKLSAGLCLFFLLGFGLWLVTGLYTLPAPLAHRDFSQVICDRHGKILRIALTGDEKYRMRMPLSALPTWALEKIIAYEDRWFWRHPGVNIFALLRSVGSMLLGGRRMGGSTLTMQTARLAYGLVTNTIPGKCQQIFLALCLERQYSKAEILEAYFNLAPYGGNVEGLASAAQIYFHKNPQQLSRLEAEALMLVPQNPVLRRPSMKNPHFLEALRRILSDGEEVASLRIYGVEDLPFLAPHLCQELLQQKDEQGPWEKRLTTLDLGRQQLLEAQLERYIARNAAFGIHNGALLLVHWPTMEVRACVGSANFRALDIHGQIDATRVRRSPGSTLKPLIYALALEQGLIHPMTLLYDTPRSFQGYDPENFDHTFRGPVSAREALASSRNVPAIALAQKLKNPDLYELLQKAHVAFAKSREYYGLALVLGGAEVTMRELASLYAMLANRGVWKPLLFEGKEVGQGVSLLTPEAAYVTLSMLEDKTGGHNLSTQGGGTVSVRWKTGTSNGFRDAWTCGVIGPYVLVVWFGNCDNRANPLLVGGRIAQPFFFELAQALAWSEPLHDYLAKPWPGLGIEKIPVCRSTGDLDISLCTDQVETWFIPGVSPVKSSGILRRISVTAEGYQACVPEEGQETVWEFWPSDLALMFQRAGVHKVPPPPFEPKCAREEPGLPPRITSPKLGLTYYASLGTGGVASLVLSAQADAGVEHLRWFVNGQYRGETAPGGILSVQLAPGIYHLLVCDEKNRTSVRTLKILSTK